MTFLKQFTLAFNTNAKKIQVAPSKFAAAGVAGGKTDPNPPTPTPKPSDGGGGISKGTIIVLVIVSLLLLFILIAVCVWYIRKKNEETERDEEIDTTRELLKRKYGSNTSNYDEESKVLETGNLLAALKHEDEQSG